MTRSVQLYKALADESRLRILRVLLTGRFSVNELVSIVEMGQSRVSRHLKLLLDAGLAQVTRQGTWAYYEVAASNGDDLAAGQLSLLQRFAAALPGAAHDEPRRLACLERRRQRSRSFHDRVAPQWSRMRQELMGDGAASARVLDALAQSGVVADLGCGAGEQLLELARGARRVIGVDASPSMLEQARLLLAGAEEVAGRADIELRLGSLEHLPLADGEVDAALLSMVLHHLADPLLVLREVRRVLAPGGLLVLCELARHDQEWMREAYGDQWLGFGEQELKRLLSDAGLVITELNHYKDPPGVGVQVAVARAPTRGAER